jgi:cysteine desulfurase
VNRIYLDSHATTPVDPIVLEAMLPYFSERFGNPSSRGQVFGIEARGAVETAREQLAAFIGAEPEEIVFTSGATESDNLAIRGAARAATSGRHVVTTALEHAAVLEPCRTLEREGFEVTRITPDSDGVVSARAVAAGIRPDTVLVSMMAANNEIGTIQPVAAVGALCRERGVLFHCDAVQAMGRMPVSVAEWQVDLMSLSAHKMYGPKGVGALFVRRGRRPRIKLRAQAEGGGQERGLRSGTLNVPGIVGFGAAAARAAACLAAGEEPRLRDLRDRLLAGLMTRIEGVTVNGSLEQRLACNLHVSIAGAEAETLILALGGRIALSAGAACAEAEGKGSHVLRALGMTDERVYTSLRFGIGRYNAEAEIDAVVEALAGAVSAARERSSPTRG